MQTEIEGRGNAALSPGGEELSELGRSREGFSLRVLEGSAALPTP